MKLKSLILAAAATVMMLGSLQAASAEELSSLSQKHFTANSTCAAAYMLAYQVGLQDTVYFDLKKTAAQHAKRALMFTNDGTTEDVLKEGGANLKLVANDGEMAVILGHCVKLSQNSGFIR